MLYNKYDMFFPGKFYFAKVVKIRQKTTTFASKSAFQHLVYNLTTSNTSRYDYNWLLYLLSFLNACFLMGKRGRVYILGKDKGG